MNFPYTPYEVEPTPSQPGITIIYRPIIPVRLTGSIGTAVLYGLLDTGADETILTRAMAELVGIITEPLKTATVMSASGEMTVEYGEVIFEFGRGRGKAQWRAVVGIVDQPWAEAVLGHTAFLRYFDATFFGGKREVRLKRNGVKLPSEL